MRDMDFTFEETPWEQTLDSLHRGDTLSAAKFLTLMEPEDEEAVEDALAELEMGGVMLDVSDLPKAAGVGEAAVRLRREEQLAGNGDFYLALEENDPLRLYLEELAAIPAQGDVRLLAEESAAGNERSREKLLNLKLSRVVELARKQVGRGVLLLDLIQEGSLGLWQAIATYKTGDFEVHCDWWINQAMARAITMQARARGMGQRLRQAMEDYRSVDERLLSDLGRNPTVEEIAMELHMSVEETRAVRDMLSSARMMNRAKQEQEPPEENEDDSRHVEDTAYFQMRQRIADLLSGLSRDDAELLTLRFGLEGGAPMSPEDAGRRLGLTPEEVVARETAALAKLRNA